MVNKESALLLPVSFLRHFGDHSYVYSLDYFNYYRADAD